MKKIKTFLMTLALLILILIVLYAAGGGFKKPAAVIKDFDSLNILYRSGGEYSENYLKFDMELRKNSKDILGSIALQFFPETEYDLSSSYTGLGVLVSEEFYEVFEDGYMGYKKASIPEFRGVSVVVPYGKGILSAFLAHKKFVQAYEVFNGYIKKEDIYTPLRFQITKTGDKKIYICAPLSLSCEQVSGMFNVALNKNIVDK